MGKGVMSAAVLTAALSLVSVMRGADSRWKDASVQVGDIKTHYLEAGSGDRHLVFIPGLMMPAEAWREQIPYFAARGFHVIAIDPRGQGMTSKTEGGNTYHQHAADLHAFLAKMKLEHCTLVGWAAAVVTILEYVSSVETLQPDRLVLVNGGPGGIADNDYPAGNSLQQARDLVSAMQEDRVKAAEAMVRGLFKSQQSGQLYKSLTDGILKMPTGAAIALLFDLLTADRRTELASISVPTLIVTSQERQMLGEYMHSKISGSELKVIPNVGHALFLEKPQSFNQALEDFLAK